MPRGADHGLIEEEISAIVEAGRVPWRRVGRLLRMVESKRLWEETHLSFTSYLEHLAARCRVSPNVLWRAYSAVQTWDRLHGELEGMGVPAPVLDQLPPAISPEIVETIEKMHRVMPPDEWARNVRDVLGGQLSRRELRARWAIVRDALEGRTARGRGTPVPRVRRTPGETAVWEAEAAFLESFPACLGYDRSARVVLFKNVPFPAGVEGNRSEVDFAFAIEEDRGILLQGVEISNWKVKDPETYFRDSRGYFDAIWLGFIQRFPGDCSALDLDGAGLLFFGPEGWRVVRKPAPREEDGCNVAEIAKQLLFRKAIL
jgi:hypothetical protein